ncbi:MAG: FAD-binding oxidoreductase [Xenococcaceae cyanobacterium MO_188.B29]|nr:FAD-binding oxidoreductase [Xenococcaceae cyanobacterium MO_188.B29]
MPNVIETQLRSLINSETELIKVTAADPNWQKKIEQAVTDSPDSTYLVFPSTVDTLSEIVKVAQQAKWRIIPCGNGSKLDWGGLTKDIQLVVSTQKCDRIIEHAVGDLTVTVEAGVKLADLQGQLKQTNQFLPIDPVFPQQATIGGIIATADTGSWREGYGGIRDMVLGISFIRADGEIAQAGGRVVKNVAGYDLMKLFTGAYGTLGIITQVTLRTYPLPEASQTVVLTGEAKEIAQATQTIRNSGLTPTAADLVSASAMDKLGMNQDTGLILRFQTIQKSIEQQTSQIKSIAQQLNLKVSHYQDEDETNLWQALLETIRLTSSETAIIGKIGIVPNAAVDLLQQLAIITANQGLTMIHASSGIGYLQIESGNNEPTFLTVIPKIRSFCQDNSGFLTILTAPKSIKQQLDIWGYTGNAVQMMQTIKQKFDPNHIFNPDRFVGGM